MKNLFPSLIAGLFAFMFCASAFAFGEQNATVVLLDANIYAQTGHYKSVIQELADKKTAAEMTTDKTQLAQLNFEIGKLTADKAATEALLKTLIAQYNAALKAK